jgi:hypothetical protein
VRQVRPTLWASPFVDGRRSRAAALHTRLGEAEIVAVNILHIRGGVGAAATASSAS